MSDEFKPFVFCRAAEDQFLDLVRQDAAQLMRLRHPGVVRVIQALDESKAAMAMVTEPIFASAANVLGRHDNVARVPSELKDLVSSWLMMFQLCIHFRLSECFCGCVSFQEYLHY